MNNEKTLPQAWEKIEGKFDKTGGDITGDLNVSNGVWIGGMANIKDRAYFAKTLEVDGTYKDLNGFPNKTDNNEDNYTNKYVQKFTSLNNSMYVISNSTENTRTFGLQVGHSSTAYASAIGTLDLNPLGGEVKANGHAVWHAGNFDPSTKWTIVTPSVDSNSKGIETGNGGLYIRHDNELNFKSSTAQLLLNYRNMGGTKITKFTFCAGDGNADTKATIECGSIVASGTIVSNNDITAFSDKRLKENIVKIDNALDIVNNINGYRYQMKADETHKIKVGVIAQEIQEVLPEVVVKNENDMLSVNYGAIVSVLIEAIKEQQKQIEELRGVVYGTAK